MLVDFLNMNKRGFFLAEETLKVLVAVICILFLAFFLVSLYNNRKSEQGIKEAEENLERIEDIISILSEGQTEVQDIPNPKGWYLYTFVEEKKPNSCFGDNCLCICKSSIEIITPQTKKCDEAGRCLIISNLGTSNLNLKIRGPDNLVFLGIRKQNGRILMGEII